MAVHLIRRVRDRQPRDVVPLTVSSRKNLLAAVSALPFIENDATNRNRVVRIGSPSLKPGERGLALVTGAGNGLYLPSGPSVDLPVSHSVAAWVFIDSTPTFHNFLSKGTTSVSWDSYTFGIGNTTTGQQRFTYVIREANAQTYLSVQQPGYIVTTGWFRVWATHDGSTLSLYVNGKLENTAAGSASAPYANSSRLFVGGSFDNALSQTGMALPYPIQDIRLCAKCLSPEEVAEDYRNSWQIFEPEAIPLFFSTVTAQYARPTSDVSAGTWTASSGSDLFAMLDETSANDTDHIVTTGTSTCEVALGTLSDPGSSSGHIVRYRISATSGGITVRLRQGTTTIATWTHASAPTSLTTYEQTLTGGEADSISDYSTLRLQFEATA